MNTLFNLNNKAALAVTILSTVLWLPLAAQAQDSSETTGHVPGTHMQMENRSHHHAMHGSMNASSCRHSNINMAYLSKYGSGNFGSGNGFSETDPASQFAMVNADELQSADVRVRQALPGFSESDPASITRLDDQAIPGDSLKRMQITQAGFAESDPAVSTSRPGADSQAQFLGICPC